MNKTTGSLIGAMVTSFGISGVFLILDTTDEVLRASPEIALLAIIAALLGALYGAYMGNS